MIPEKIWSSNIFPPKISSTFPCLVHWKFVFYTIFQLSHVQSYVRTVFLVSPSKRYYILFAISENSNWKLNLSAWLLLLDEKKEIQQWPFISSNQRYTWCYSLVSTYSQQRLPCRHTPPDCIFLLQSPQLWAFLLHFPWWSQGLVLKLTVNNFPPFTFTIPLMIL